MTTVFTALATILAAITACSDGEFSGANGQISKKEPIWQTCVPTPDKECNKPLIETDDEKK